MKRFLLSIALLIASIPNAQAAVIPKAMVQFAQVDSAAIGVVASGSQLLVFGNREMNGFAQLVNGTTIELTAGIESFVSAATVDNILILSNITAGELNLLNSQVVSRTSE